MNKKIALVIIVVLAVAALSATASGLFFSQYFWVDPIVCFKRNPVVKRTSAQEYAEREARMIKEASLWILDYQQDEATRLRFSEDVKNVMNP